MKLIQRGIDEMFLHLTKFIDVATNKYNAFVQCFLIPIFIIAIIFIGSINYFLIFSLIEIINIIFAFVITYIAIKSSNKNSSFIILAVLYGFVALFDLLHFLVYKGIGISVINNSVIVTEIWLIARYIESISILIFIVFYNKKINIYRVIIFFASITMLLFIMILHYNYIPTKINVSVITILQQLRHFLSIIILVIAILKMNYNKKSYKSKTYYFLVLSMITQISLFMYTSEYGIINIVGSIVRIFSYYFIYKVIVQEDNENANAKFEWDKIKSNDFIEMLPCPTLIETNREIIFANDATYDLLGITSLEEIEEKVINDFSKTNEKSLDSDFKDKNVNMLNNKNIKFTNYYGKEIKGNIMKFPCTYNGDDSNIIILHKYTENLNKQQSVNLKNNCNYVNKDDHDPIKDNFFINISHEFKTPLNVILGITQLLELEFKKSRTEMDMPSYLNEYMKTLKYNSYRLWRLIDNLIDISKINTNSFEVIMQNNNIVSVVEDIVLSATSHLEKNDIDIIFDTEVEEKILACDADLIERIILNLISNGIKFAKNKGEILIKLIDEGEIFTIIVEDNGIGIPKDKIETIFDYFSKVDQSLTRNTEGSGMGLALVAHLVKIHGGSISVESEKGQGSKFIIKLPVSTVENTTKKKSYSQVKKERINIEFSDIYSVKYQ
ncbi:MAG: MASE3 domain-containing protein [Eubacteriaceae bacterium]